MNKYSLFKEYMQTLYTFMPAMSIVLEHIFRENYHKNRGFAPERREGGLFLPQVKMVDEVFFVFPQGLPFVDDLKKPLHLV